MGTYNQSIRIEGVNQIGQKLRAHRLEVESVSRSQLMVSEQERKLEKTIIRETFKYRRKINHNISRSIKFQ